MRCVNEKLRFSRKYKRSCAKLVSTKCHFCHSIHFFMCRTLIKARHLSCFAQKCFSLIAIWYIRLLNMHCVLFFTRAKLQRAEMWQLGNNFVYWCHWRLAENFCRFTCQRKPVSFICISISKIALILEHPSKNYPLPSTEWISNQKCSQYTRANIQFLSKLYFVAEEN